MSSYNKSAASEMDLMMVEYRLKNRVNEVTSAASDALSLMVSTAESIGRRFEQLCAIEEIALRMGKNAPRLSWSPETGQRGSLTQNQENDQHVKKETSAQCRVEIARRA